MSNKNLTIGLLVAVVIAIGGYFFPQIVEVSENIGSAINCQAVTCFTTVGILNSLQSDTSTQIGSSGTAVARMNTGTCNIRSSATSIAASAMQTVECNAGTVSNVALTGVTAGDMCFLTAASSTAAATGPNIYIQGTSASSTFAGSITAVLGNASTTAFTYTAAATTSWQYVCLDPA